MTRVHTLSLEEHVDERLRVDRQNRMIRLGCGSGALLLMIMAGLFVLPGLHKQRVELEIVVHPDKFADMPPGVTVPSALLSTFRGLMVNMLWTRAAELKDEGKFYELQQLHDWICELQPRFPKVWENASWNMAYNISVGTYSERERWHWVYAGVSILRDKGIPYNPKTINMYYQLAWIYLHKMGDFLDDHHFAYKRNWAVIMERVLGEPPDEPNDDQIIEPFRRMRTAAQEIRKIGALHGDEAILRYINADTASYGMAQFLIRIRELGYEPDMAFLEHVARYGRRGLIESDLYVDSIEFDPDQTIAKFRSLMQNEKYDVSRQQFLDAVRAHVLAKDLKLNVIRMADLMERYGPVDWRTVDSQGLYWASLGADECFGVVGIDENVEMNTARYVQFALKNACERGRLILEPDFVDPFASYIGLYPNYRFTDTVHELYLEQAEKYRGNEPEESYYREGPAGRLFKDGHVNFLHEAVRALYLEGREQQAREYYTYLYDNYMDLRTGERKEMYQKPLEEFIARNYYEDMDSYKKARVLINGMIESALIRLAHGRDREAARRLEFAKEGYNQYNEGKLIDRSERRQFPPWEFMVAGALERYITHYPMPVVLKSKVWRIVDVEMQYMTYNRLKDKFETLCAAAQPYPFDPLKAFPPPPDLEDYTTDWTAQQFKDYLDDATYGDVEVSGGSKR